MNNHLVPGSQYNYQNVNYQQAMPNYTGAQEYMQNYQAQTGMPTQGGFPGQGMPGQPIYSTMSPNGGMAMQQNQQNPSFYPQQNNMTQPQNGTR